MQCNKLGVMDQILHSCEMCEDKKCGDVGPAWLRGFAHEGELHPQEHLTAHCCLWLQVSCCLLQPCSVLTGRNSACVCRRTESLRLAGTGAEPCQILCLCCLCASHLQNPLQLMCLSLRPSWHRGRDLLSYNPVWVWGWDRKNPFLPLPLVNVRKALLTVAAGAGGASGQHGLNSVPHVQLCPEGLKLLPLQTTHL